MEFLWTSPDGLAFPCERWEPAGEARGVMIFLPGMSGAATDFDTLALAVAQAGIAGYALNLRGQGHDPITRRRGTELNLRQIEKDIAAFGREVMREYPATPIFWIGESMGSLVLMHLLTMPSFDLPVSGAIFSAPVVGLRKQTPPMVRWALGVLAGVAPRFRLHPGLFVTHKGAPIRVTRDEEFRARVRESSHFIPVFSLGFLHSLGKLIESSNSLARKVTVPSLVMAAGQDVFVDTTQIRGWFKDLAAPDKTLHIYPEAFHCLWNDLDRATVIADILNWLETRL